MGLGLAPLQPQLIVSAVSMGANITSTPLGIGGYDNVAIQFVWTGTPTGFFGVEVSLDQSNWVALILPITPQAAGSADTAMVELNQVPFPNIRVTYARTSGTGTLNAYIAAKAL